MARKPATIMSILVAFAIFFTASTLRSPLTSLGALSPFIRTDLGLSAGLVGLLTTLPLLIFAFASPIVGALAERFSKKRVLIVGMVLITIGILLRSYGGDIGLFAGTVILGTGISTGNVLLPAIVKEDFPARIGAMTALFTTTMTMFAGGFAGIASALADSSLGWRTILVAIAPLSIVAFILWIAAKRFERKGGERARTTKSTRPRQRRLFDPRILRNPLAWWIMLLFGLQSILFYCSVAWLPSILASHGIGSGTIALCVALFPIMAMPCTMLLPPLAQRMRSQRLLGVAIGICCAVSTVFVWMSQSDIWAIFAVAFYGLALGAPFCLCMFYFGFRTENADDAAELSSFSQTLGYLMAAIGPTCLGAVYDATFSWDAPLAVMLALSFAIILCGWKTGSGKIPADDAADSEG